MVHVQRPWRFTIYCLNIKKRPLYYPSSSLLDGYCLSQLHPLLETICNLPYPWVNNFIASLLPLEFHENLLQLVKIVAASVHQHICYLVTNKR
ncbi:unnamed protein product [Schistosoma rodhaini]|nr:unnamed protein product [Schistosoma rodhaini]